MKLMNALACLGLAIISASSINADGWVSCVSIRTGDIRITTVEKDETEKMACKRLGKDYVPQYLKIGK